MLPDSAHVRMLHPNAVEIYLPVGTGRGKRLVIGHMFRESEYFEPVHDASLTLKKYQSWLRDQKAEESDLMVFSKGKKGDGRRVTSQMTKLVN